MNKLTQHLISPFGWLFGAAAIARRQLYANDVLKTVDLRVPVVSIGNLTVGGTGKTPLVVFVAKILARNGHRVCVLTRGYKRDHPNDRVLVSNSERILTDARTAGDEPFELASKLLGAAVVIADKNRAAAGVWAREQLGVTAFVLDDGFQHFGVKRDLDIVCVDATNPFGNGKLLPVGILRELPKSLERADCIVLTRTDLSAEVNSLKFKVQSLNAACSILVSKSQIIELRELKKIRAKPQDSPSEESKIQNLKPKISLAFCALGNPQGFFESLRNANFQVKTTTAFRDHHAYKQSDVDNIEEEAELNGAEILLTTAKDAVKLTELKFSLPCFVVEIEIVFDDEKLLSEMLCAL